MKPPICTECIYDVYYAELDRLRAALKKARRPHLIVEGDCYYSCPKSGDACGANEADHCNCGADEINAIIDAALAGS